MEGPGLELEESENPESAIHGTCDLGHSFKPQFPHLSGKLRMFNAVCNFSGKLM